MNIHRKLASLIIRGRIIILAAMMLAVLLAVSAVSRTVINYDMAKYLAEDTMTKKALHMMESEFDDSNRLEDSAAESEERINDLQKRIGEEIPVALMIAVAVVLVMLTVTSHAWLEPLVILFVLAVSILLNMGTNFIFTDVSFVTFAVCPILQLALSIDYAIMLLHAYNACRDGGMDAIQAMTEALAECFMRISSSAMTTIAGLLSLLFMSFTIGFDIGLVLSKGILFSMLGVFLLMPAVTLMLDKAIRRTRHRPLTIGGKQLAGFISRHRKLLAGGLTMLVLAGLYLNSRNVYTFADAGAEPSPLVLLVPGGEEDADYDRQRDLVSRLQTLMLSDGSPATGEILSMVTTGADAIRYYTAEEIAETGIPLFLVQGHFYLNGFGNSVRADRLLDSVSALSGFIPQIAEMQAQVQQARSAFIGPRYSRLAVMLNFTPSDPGLIRYMEDIFGAVRGVYGDDYYPTGSPMSTYDISHAFRDDLLKVNLITLSAILLIVALSFRSLRMPAILVFVIEGAIWVTMGFSRLIGQPIFFISYLICLSIQMGATIDYGILLADQYRARRREGMASGEAMTAALEKSLPTILTSGVILVVAGFAVGKVCSIYYIYSIGLLVSRGALVSALLILTLLPALLLTGDRFVIKAKRNHK